MKDLSTAKLAERLACAIDWPRLFVGVRFLFTEEEYDSVDAVDVKRPIHFCQMVNSATRGHSLKGAEAALVGCPAAVRVLGIIEPGEFHRSGCRAFGNRLYHDLGTAKYSRDRQTMCDHRAHGVLVKPLRDFADDERPPQVVHVITNAYHAMRLLQGYTHFYGIYGNFKMSGLQAICSESTAYPYMANDVNISMLCGGTRIFCQWDDAEVDFSIPYSKFALTVEGTLRTMDLEDPDDKKAVARKKLAAAGMADEFPLTDGFNYCKIKQNLPPQG